MRFDPMSAAVGLVAGLAVAGGAATGLVWYQESQQDAALAQAARQIGLTLAGGPDADAPAAPAAPSLADREAALREEAAHTEMLSRAYAEGWLETVLADPSEWGVQAGPSWDTLGKIARDRVLDAVLYTTRDPDAVITIRSADTGAPIATYSAEHGYRPL